jgi:hypothetical protein
MLVSNILFLIFSITIAVAGLYGMVRLGSYYKENKSQEPSAILGIVIICLVFAPFVCFCTDVMPEVYIVDEVKYEKKILIGSFSKKLDDGTIVKVKGNCVVNNSAGNLYVETVKYSSHVSDFNPDYPYHFYINNREKILPYSVYKGRIDYGFETPPQSIRIKKGESLFKYWLQRDNQSKK